MENLLIDVLFGEVCQSVEYYNMPEVSQARRVAEKSDDKLRILLGEKLFHEADGLVTEQVGAYERSAFIVGFKTAMRLISESCNFPFTKDGVSDD